MSDWRCKVLLIALLFSVSDAGAHLVPPEQFHPIAEAYRRAKFVLNLDPVVWEQVRVDVTTIGNYWKTFDTSAANAFLAKTNIIIDRAIATKQGDDFDPISGNPAASQVFDLMTQAVSAIACHHIETAQSMLTQWLAARRHLSQAVGVWAAFQSTVAVTDPEGFHKLGRAWLATFSALGAPGLMKIGYVPVDRASFEESSGRILSYIKTNFGSNFTHAKGRELAPLPVNSPSFDFMARLDVKLPPGSSINVQIPRPRQILNMVAHGVDEKKTPLIALGDAAFDNAYIFGEPARSLGINCNTCHNKGSTNPKFTIPGLSARKGGMDVSNSFFAPHANNGHFDPLDIPDLRGARFTAPYGRNGRTTSLREFIRNVIVNEFNGEEPDNILLDAMVAYINEFDFLPNPALNNDGTLNEKASKAALRGEKIFKRQFAQMANMSCASCHMPSANFIDHKQHDIGTVKGATPNSKDRALDTPTLLGVKFTAPYFHDGSQPTLRAVNEWFNDSYKLGLTDKQLDDLTAYVETIGDGEEPYEDTVYIVEAEMEEQDIFLSSFEFLDAKNKRKLMGLLFQGIALEVRNEKWGLQNKQYVPVMERLAGIMDEAYVAVQAGDMEKVRDRVKAYRKLYKNNGDVLK